MEVWDIVTPVLTALIGGLVGVFLTWWRMKANSAIRQNEKHNSALNAIDSWVGHVRRFFVKYNLQKVTNDFRLLYMGLTPSEVASMTALTRNILRLATDIRDVDLSSPLKEILEELEEFEDVLSQSRWEDEDIAACVDRLRDGYESFLELVSDVKRK